MQVLDLLHGGQGDPHNTLQRVTNRVCLGLGKEKGRTVRICNHAHHCSAEQSCLRDIRDAVTEW